MYSGVAFRLICDNQRSQRSGERTNARAALLAHAVRAAVS